MTEQFVDRLARFWGCEPLLVGAAAAGYRNQSWPVTLANGNQVNVILFKREQGMVERVRRADCVAALAAARGLPVRTRLHPQLIQVRQGAAVRYAGLYNYLPGNTISWEAYNKAHLKLLGTAMADLHAAFSQESIGSTNYVAPSVAAEYLALVGRMERYFAAPGSARAAANKLGVRLRVDWRWYAELLRAFAAMPGQHWLHMDLVRGNVLFEHAPSGPRLSGIIDFEKAGFGHPLFDIARTLAFLLVDCKYKSAAETQRYFLESGYRRRGGRAVPRVVIKRKNGRADGLAALVQLFLLHDFYKFLRHNPYESLHDNEHYLRCTALLLQNGALETAD